MSEASKQARDEIPHLISELMEARMQSIEVLYQLKLTMKAIQQIRADSGSGRSPTPIRRAGAFADVHVQPELESALNW